jgi:hypothetical protein
MSIYAYLSFRGNWNGSDAACYFTRYEIYVEFYDVSGNYHWDNIGRVTMGHLTSWNQSVGTYINPNTSRSSGGGSTISYISGVYIGDTYAGSGGCSSGTHAHVEGVTYHGYGAQYEWHGEGPDMFDYDSSASANWHVHGCKTVSLCGAYPAFSTWDDTTFGTVVGFLGGATSNANMW